MAKCLRCREPLIPPLRYYCDACFRGITQQEVLDKVTNRIVSKEGHQALWAENWMAQPVCPPQMDSMTICGTCKKPFVKIGWCSLHAGDPRILLVDLELPSYASRLENSGRIAE